MSTTKKFSCTEIIKTIDDEQEVENYSEDSDVEIEVSVFF